VTMKSLQILLIAATVVALPACGDDPVTPAGDAMPDAMPDSDVPPPPMMDAGPDAPPPTGGDGNESFADAVEVTVNSMDGAGGAIGVPGDHDFYSFEGAAGEWMIIDTDANPDDDTTKVDTVIRLFDSEMNMLAENDDSVPRVNTDSEIITRLPNAGTYYIEVLEFSDWRADDGVEPEGDPSYSYNLTVTRINPMAETVTVDAEAGDDDASAQAFPVTAGTINLLLGTFEDGTDTDVFSIAVPAGMALNNLSAEIMPSGPTGYGSTSDAGNIELANAEGTAVIARINQSMGQSDLGPTVAESTTYLVRVTHSGGRIGTNDFYVLKVTIGAENTPEAFETENDMLAGAEALDSMVRPDGTRSAFLLANLISDEDVDHFSLAPMAGEQLTAVCGSASSGSGVRGLTLSIHNAAGTMLTSASESATESALVRDFAVPAGSSSLIVRLSKTSQDAEVTSDFVRCGFHLSTPM